MFDQLTATWEDFLAVNYMGIINASNAVIPYLWEQRSGSIVNISSTAAFPLRLPTTSAARPTRPGAEHPPEGYGDDEVDGDPPDPVDGAAARRSEHPGQRGVPRHDDVAGRQGRRARSRSSTR